MGFQPLENAKSHERQRDQHGLEQCTTYGSNNAKVTKCDRLNDEIAGLHQASNKSCLDRSP